MNRTKIFVSYSHDDREWLDRLATHLAVLERKGRVELWSDDRIRIGAEWQAEIENALAASRVAVLLISPSFLASKFIWHEEMPHILRHESGGMEVLPLIVRPCAWLLEPDLAKLQARPRDGRPLSLGGASQIDLDIACFIYELAAKVDEFNATIATRETTKIERFASDASLVHQREPEDQRLRNKLLKRRHKNIAIPLEWSGFYNKGRAIKLMIRDTTENEFRGRLEYPSEGTITIIEGRVLPDVEDAGVTWAQIGPGDLRLQFRETGYVKEGTKPINFDGEYRAVVAGEKMRGAWFQGKSVVGDFELESPGTRSKRRRS